MNLVARRAIIGAGGGGEGGGREEVDRRFSPLAARLGEKERRGERGEGMRGEQR